MTSLQAYENPPHPGLTRVSAERGAEIALTSEWDSWIYTFAQTCQLAQYIQHTEMVPKEAKGRPDVIAAIILAGREMHIAPMAALTHLFIVRGRLGQSAQMMRAKALAAGHEIVYKEQSDTRVIVWGRRSNSAEWTKVTFTADQARRLGISLGGGGRDGGYTAEDKLVARATSRLCKRVFADCISGLPSVDELEDADLVDGGDGPPAAAARNGRSMQRRRASQRLDTGTPPETATNGEAAESASAEADESGGTETTDETGEAASDDAGTPEVRMAIQPQMKALGMIFTRTLEVKDVSDGRPYQDRHLITSALIGRLVESWSELTYEQAGAVIEATSKAPRDRDELRTWVTGKIQRGAEMVTEKMRAEDEKAAEEYAAEMTGDAQAEGDWTGDNPDESGAAPEDGGVEDADVVGENEGENGDGTRSE